MLLTSYLLGCDEQDQARHLAVDAILPEKIDNVVTSLHSREGCEGETFYDLVIQFPDAPSPQNIICFPDLPDRVTAQLLDGNLLPIIDFAYSRVVQASLPSNQRRCA